MTKDLEKLYKQINQAIDKAKPSGEEEANQIIRKLVEEYNRNINSTRNGKPLKKSREDESDDYLEKAHQAEDLATAIRYADKAIELNPDNFDAKTFRIILRNDVFDRLKDLDVILSQEEEKLRKEGYFNDEGHFWLIVETRPYMRGLTLKREILESLCRTTEAIEVSEKILKLCRNDNLGTRYHLISYYAMMENLKKALSLHKKYGNEKSLGFYLPIAICYFRLGKYDECRETIREMTTVNKYAVKMLKKKNILDSSSEDFFSPGKESEVLMAVDCNRDLLYATLPFFDFLEECT